MTLNTAFKILILSCITRIGVAQSSEKSFTIYAQVLNIDTVNRELLYENTFVGGHKYFHDVFHLKVLTNTGDTTMIGLVYNIKRDRDSALNSMGIKRRAFYAFYVSYFMPCNSNYPSMYGCDCEKPDAKCEISPTKGKIFPKPYLKIPRVFDFFRLNDENVQKLFKHS